VKQTGQSNGVLNADSCKTVTCFKFDTRFQGQSGHDPLKFMEKGPGQGHVTPKCLGIKCL